MIISRLTGGLGNQLFQYAAGRALANRLDVNLMLDISHLTHDNKRSYALSELSIQAGIASIQQARIVAYGARNRLQRIADIFTRRSEVTSENCFVQKNCQYEARFESLSDNTYLDGYWQNERYFATIRDLLIDEFRVKVPLQGRNLGIAEQITRSIAVSVHVRRGDYVNDSRIASLHGNCGPSYYEQCLSEISRNCPEARFFVFSDEPAWVRRQMALPSSAVVVDHNGPGEAHEDLRLMSLCRHHIIANSSFSWWGAWLCTAGNKMVYAPMRWFGNADIDTTQLIPDCWNRR